jgi:nicotinamidase-related amidase
MKNVPAYRRLNPLWRSLACVFVSAPVLALAQKPSPRLLDPQNHVLILIDHQPQMAFAVRSIDVAELRNNTTGLAKAAKAFSVPTILTTVAEKTFSGPLFPEVQAVFSQLKPIDRTTMNCWEDSRVVEIVKRSGKKKIVMAGLWTEVCGVGPVLSAIDEGYEVYFVSDASGGVTNDAHNRAITRMEQAGAHTMTWIQYLLELQRDWARSATYDITNQIVKDHAGGYGLGVIYAKTMFSAQEGK